MPKTYTVEVEYLVPVYVQVQVEAENELGACNKAEQLELEDPTFFDGQEEDFDNSSATYVNGVWEGEEAYEGENLIPDVAKEHARLVRAEYAGFKFAKEAA
jgi:hypothetical protein